MICVFESKEGNTEKDSKRKHEQMHNDIEPHAFAYAKRDSVSTWELIVLPAKPF